MSISDGAWRDILQRLESSLAQLDADGVTWLSLPPDEELRALLERSAAVTAPPAPPAVRSASAAPAAPPTAASGQPRPAPPLPPRPAARAAPAAPESARAGAPPAAAVGMPVAGAGAVEDVPPGAGVPDMPMSQIKTLESLQAQFRNCMACRLGQTRTRLVFGVGHSSPRLLFIGEGPGAEEDQQGLPFVGRAGALLTGLITGLGLTREDVYIANVVKCRPPDNRNPEPDEVLACRRILERQMELLHPALIVTLGNVPLKALNPSAGGITRERGQVFQYREWPVLPTFHPSYLLRNQGALADCWTDFKAAFARAYPEG